MFFTTLSFLTNRPNSTIFSARLSGCSIGNLGDESLVYLDRLKPEHFRCTWGAAVIQQCAWQIPKDGPFRSTRIMPVLQRPRRRLGIVAPGDSFLSLGTSGVVFTVTDRFAPAADSGAHAFCHALPRSWHQAHDRTGYPACRKAEPGA